MDSITYNPEVWIELVKAVTLGIVTIITVWNAGKIADASSNTFTKILDFIRDWRKK